MSFIKNDLPEIALWDHKTVLKEQSAFIIDMIALILQNALLDTNLRFLHHNIKKLSLVNLIFQGWRDFKICKESLQNILQIDLAENFTKFGLKRLQNQSIAICLFAQRVCNNISFSRSV